MEASSVAKVVLLHLSHNELRAQVTDKHHLEEEIVPTLVLHKGYKYYPTSKNKKTHKVPRSKQFNFTNFVFRIEV